MPTEFEIRPMFAKYSAISMDRLRVWQSFGEDEFECYEHSQTPPGRAVGGRRSLGSLATAMRSVIATLVAFLLAGCAAPTHSSRPEAGKLVAQERKEADAILNGRHERVCAAIEKYMAAKKVTGASVAIAQDGQLDFAQGFGCADLENDVPYQSETVNRLASVSKTITAVAVMQLVEAGKIDLDADIRTYVPEFPDKGEKITARHILTHTSGIRHYQPDESENYTRLASVVDGLKRFTADPLLHPPGEKFTYSPGDGDCRKGCMV
jgi:CubicO group peptidase (beta-lactamase class C family)